MRKNQTKPLFSVIIPTFNRANHLKKSIQSVINQSCNNWELIVVDDGSTDDTKNVIYSFKELRIKYIYQEKKERSAARNLGIRKATGKYICFLDDDDYLLPAYLADFQKNIEAKKYEDIIYRTGYFREFESGDRLKSENYSIKKHKNPVNFAAFNMCGVWSLCIPVNFLKEDNFPEQFPHWQDTHLILRLLSKHPFYQSDNYNYVYRIHAQMGSISLFSNSSFDFRMNLNLAAINDLFNHYHDLVNPYVGKNTKNYLLAEKQLQYAIKAIKIRGRQKSLVFFLRSIKFSFSLSLWRFYLNFCIKFLGL